MARSELSPSHREPGNPVDGTRSAPDLYPLYPIFMDLIDRPVVVVGAGEVAARRVPALVAAGARVQVVAPLAHQVIEELALADRLTWHRRPYRRGDLAEVRLALAATDDPAVNDAVAGEARVLGILCGRADGGGDFSVPAAVRRGALTVAVSSGGRAPALARRLRRELEGWLAPELAALTELLGELRDEARELPTAGRRQLLHELAADGVLRERLAAGDRRGAWRRAAARLRATGPATGAAPPG